MTNSRLPWLVVVLALLFHDGAAQESPAAQQLIDAAHRVSDLTNIGPYTLTANVVINPGNKKTGKTGRLMISRDGDRVREELEVGSVREVRVFQGHKQFVIPGQGLIFGLELAQFDRLWDPAWTPRFTVPPSKFSWSGAKPDKVQGADAWCLNKEYEYSRRSLCFDAVNAALLRESSGSHASRQFFDFTAIADHYLYPQRVLIMNPDVEVNQIQIRPAPVNSDLFNPPDKALELEGCEDRTPPKATHAPSPDYPEAERREKKQGTVRIYALINKEGKIAAQQVITAPTDGLGREAVATAKKFRFQPATCGGRPVHQEMIIEIDFHLY